MARGGPSWSDYAGMSNQSDTTVQDYIKIFLVSLVTSVGVLFGLGPVMLKLNTPQGPRPQAEAAAPSAAAEPSAPAEVEMTAPNLQGLAVDEATKRWRSEGIEISFQFLGERDLVKRWTFDDLLYCIDFEPVNLFSKSKNQGQFHGSILIILDQFELLDDLKHRFGHGGEILC